MTGLHEYSSYHSGCLQLNTVEGKSGGLKTAICACADEVHSPYITATFLAPTNDAFAKLLHSLGSSKQQLLANPSM